MTPSNDGPTGLPLALWLMLIVIALAASITVWTVAQLFKSRRKTELLKAQTELQLRLLDKISSSEELRSFLDSPSVRTLMENHAQALRAEPQDRILGCLVPGCILTPAGTLLIIEGQGTVRFLGSLSLATGIGFLVAAVIGYWLTRSWGITDQRADKD
jgi:hypothetical protein